MMLGVIIPSLGALRSESYCPLRTLVSNSRDAIALCVDETHLRALAGGRFRLEIWGGCWRFLNCKVGVAHAFSPG